MITVSNGKMPQAAMNIIDEKVTIGIQLNCEVSYPKEVMYEKTPKIDRDMQLPIADTVNNGFRPILSTKLKRVRRKFFLECETQFRLNLFDFLTEYHSTFRWIE